MILDDMTWSYSRIGSYHMCPYQFFLKYLYGEKEKPMWYASYGSFMHKLIEQFYKGELNKSNMQTKFLYDFQNEVKGERPSGNTVTKYIQSGLNYLSHFSPFPFNTIAVEKKYEFFINDIPFVGVIDYLGEMNGDYYIVDNKSRDLKPRSGKQIPTSKDKELDDMLKQLYIYSAAIKQEYGKFPKYLCFNCFKTQTFIKEPFNTESYNSAVNWAYQSVKNICNNYNFLPKLNYFGCNYLCGLSDGCCYKEMG